MIRINQSTIRDCLIKEMRVDGRQLDMYRRIVITNDTKGTLIELGSTIIYVKSVLTLERVEKSRLILECDPSERWMSSVLDQSIDMESLMVNKKVGWIIKVQLVKIQDDGNLNDAYFIGVLANLLTIKKLHVDAKLNILSKDIRNPSQLQLLYYPVSITICLFEDKLIVDPTLEECDLAEGIVAIVVNEHEEVCSFLPLKATILNAAQINDLFTLAIAKASEIRTFVRQYKK